MDNERRADLGSDAVWAAAKETNVHAAEPLETAIIDVLAYIAHFCDRAGIDPVLAFARGMNSYAGDFEDGPKAVEQLDAELPFIAQHPRADGERDGH